MYIPPKPASRLGAPAAALAAILVLSVIQGPQAHAQGANGSWMHLPPPTVDETGAAYDRARDRLLLFGGRQGELVTNELWALSLNGTPTWSQIVTVGARPAARISHNLLYDTVNDRLWLFGGSDASDTPLGDVWTLALGVSPLTWTQAFPAGPAPSPRVYASAVLDTLNDRVILFGGAETVIHEGPPSDLVSDVWAMPLTNPLAWTQITPSGTPPSPRAGAQIIWDGANQRLVLFGGFDGGMLDDAHALSLSGSPAWSSLTPTGVPPGGRAVGGAVWDPAGGRMIIYGGVGGTGEDMLTDLWTLSLGGSPAWTELTPPGSWPSLRQMPCAVYDSQDNAIVIYGARDTSGGVVSDLAWSLNLSGSPQWTQIAGGLIPSRESAGGIFDPLRNRLVVYGGTSWPDQFFGDVWTYDASGAWTQLAPAGGDPGARWGYSAIYDPLRDRMVAYGGSDENNNSQGDVWALSFAGTPTWTPLVTIGGPPGARTQHVAVYDRLRDRMVIHGGFGPSNTNEAWALDFTTNAWSLLDPGFSGPSGRQGHVAVYDTRHDRMVMFGGGGSDSTVWALPFGGGGWQPLAFVGTPPPGRYGMGAAYDTTVHTMILFGGVDETWNTSSNTSTALLLRNSPTWMPLDFGADVPPARRNFVTGYDQSPATLFVTGGCCNGLTDVWAASFDVSTPVQASLVNASAAPGRVQVTWLVRGGTGAVTIQRNDGSGWAVAAVRHPDGRGILAFEDRDVAAGGRYGYRLLLSTDGEVNPVSEVWLEVSDDASFALDGFQPNPAASGASVAFRLGSGAPARLRVLDVAGRSVLSREVGMLGPGSHVVPVHGAAAGVYLLQLTQGGRSITRKATLLP